VLYITDTIREIDVKRKFSQTNCESWCFDDDEDPCRGLPGCDAFQAGWAYEMYYTTP